MQILLQDRVFPVRKSLERILKDPSPDLFSDRFISVELPASVGILLFARELFI